jgi:FMN phosphatase YigB (HAD superfamily)
MTPHAILFDLYGTLVKAGARPFSRGLPAALGIPRAAWVTLLRDGLLTRPFASNAAFAEFVARTLTPQDISSAAATCAALVEEECGAVTAVPGAVSLLAFLKRRGIKLGLVSNLASPFKGPAAALGIAAALDTAMYSCDEGLAKPDRRRQSAQ